AGASTGVAGPDPDARGNPVGLVYLALAAPAGPGVRKIQQGLGRARVRPVSASPGFDLARRYLSGREVK
ncbi:CinA family protein, partial [Flavonifractor plautii]|uniref:CinA family protein n=1 Tax=Flavonifractor plautii TaxID=292800 RepID=UPI00210CD760